jgi:hypothetical protein
VETGRVDEARTVLERGAKLGEVESWLPLGNLYADELGDAAAAETAYRSGIAAGDTYCHHNLGVCCSSAVQASRRGSSSAGRGPPATRSQQQALRNLPGQ